MAGMAWDRMRGTRYLAFPTGFQKSAREKERKKEKGDKGGIEEGREERREEGRVRKEKRKETKEGKRKKRGIIAVVGGWCQEGGCWIGLDIFASRNASSSTN